MEEYHLVKQFSKPKEGEYVPITFVEFRRKLVGWSPELKRSVYIENEEEKAKLKRVREVNVMVAINHLSGKTSSIELTDEEKAQFEEVYKFFLEKGGQLVYTRKKIGAKIVSFFELKESEKKVREASGKSLLSERI
ncbi:MAG: hypothetical protein KKD69_05450 [Euryarchaeota archaeon]|nr:hypothetical protein [Euryarchaeota archaeon]MCG2727040.1 hypothetical protein [Candidatus Methanoperedenaceae archaeon]